MRNETGTICAMTNSEYRNLINKMLENVTDNDTLRFLCILIHDYSNIEYPI